MARRMRAGRTATAWLPVAALLLIGLGAADVTWAQTTGVAPATGFNPRPDNLRGDISALLPSALPRSTGRAWEINPSVTVRLGVTDNGQGADRRSGSADVFTTIAPAVQVTGDTARLRLRLYYSPIFNAYARNGNQNRISNALSGQALATVVPDAVFLDARAIASQQSRYGGFGNDNSQALNRDDNVETFSFSLTPYAVHRFGSWGTARIGYSVVRTLQDDRGNQQPNVNTGLLPGYGVTGNLTTQRERASFVTGENLGRFNNEIVVEAIQYSGSGSYRNAHRNSVNNELSYAVTRTIYLLGGIGYQDLQFSGTPPVRISEPTWNFGTRLIPNADSSITVMYGHRDGFTAASFDGAYSPTARTRIYGRYSTGLTSSAEEQQALLDTTTVGPGGLLVDSVTGAPVSGTSSVFGTQNGISKVKRLSVTGILLLERDSFSAGVTSQDQTTLTNTVSFNGTPVGAGTSTSSVYATLGWSHELSPAITASTSVSYGVTHNGALLGTTSREAQNTLTFSASASRTFTETLSGQVQYSYYERTGGQANGIPASQGGNTSQNLLFVSLRKSF